VRNALPASNDYHGSTRSARVKAPANKLRPRAIKRTKMAKPRRP